MSRADSNSAFQRPRPGELPPEAARLLGLLFQPDDLIEIRVIDPGGDVHRDWITLAKPSPAAVANVVGANAVRRVGVYFSVCPRRSRGGKKEHVARGRCLWADLDGGTQPDAAAYQCDVAEIPPTATVSSGGGTHLYWLLTEPIEFDSPEAIAKVENANKRIALALGGDSVSDISRVMRLPGFSNYKYDPARPCKLVKHDGPRWDFGRLCEFLPELPAEAPAIPPVDGNGKAHGPVDDRLVGKALRLLADDPPDGDRSRRDHGALCLLHKAGCTEGQAQALCSGFSKFSDGRPDYFRRSWTAAVKCVESEPPPIGNTPAGGAKNKGIVAVASVAKPKIDIPEWLPCPVTSLPPRMLEIVNAIAQSTFTDPAFAALGAVVMAAACIGNRVAVLLKSGWTEPAILWGALVGRSGTVKSPVLKAITSPLVELYQRDRAEHVRALEEHARATERYAVQLASWKQSQRKGPPSDPPLKPEPPKERRVLVSDITSEALGAKLAENPLGLIAVREELSGWAGSFDRYAPGGKGSDQSMWLSMYDGSPTVIDRRGGGTLFIRRAAVSVFGSIQPGILQRQFGSSEREGGLLARILLTCPPERPAKWSEARLDENVEARWDSLLNRLLQLAPGIDDDGYPRPRYLPLGDDAKALWVPWHDAHAEETLGIANDDLAAHYAKLRGVCARLALVMACVRTADCHAPVNSISPEDMQRAITLTNWLKSEAARVYAVLSEDDATRETRLLVEWIQRRGGSCSVRDLTRGPRRFRDDPEGAKSALEGLVKAGWGVLGYDGGPGRPSPTFTLDCSGDGDKTPRDAIANDGFGFETADIDGDSTRGASAADAPLDVLEADCRGADPPADYHSGT